MGPLPGTLDVRNSGSTDWVGGEDTKRSQKNHELTKENNMKNNKEKGNNEITNNCKWTEEQNILNQTLLKDRTNTMGTTVIDPEILGTTVIGPETLGTTVIDSETLGTTVIGPDTELIINNIDNDNAENDVNSTKNNKDSTITAVKSVSDGTSNGIRSSDKKPLPSAQGSHYIVQACVSGFVPIKYRLQKDLIQDRIQDTIRDMAYVVEVTWSDGRTHMVKRTFSDFYNFHFYLLDEWGTKSIRDGPLRLTFYLPERETGQTESSIEIAESRELQLNRYVQELIKLDKQISASPTVLTFFESRGSDPKPYRETVSPSQMEVADQYMLCWI